VVELEPVPDELVTPVVEAVEDDDVPVVVEVVPSPWPLTVVPSPLGVAPPPEIIVELPPVFFDFSFDGILTVVVDVVTVVGVDRAVSCGDVAAILIACVSDGGLAATGAASSGGSTLTLELEPAAEDVTCRVAGATSAACAR